MMDAIQKVRRFSCLISIILHILSEYTKMVDSLKNYNNTLKAIKTKKAAKTDCFLFNGFAANFVSF